jgi:hypothetical protein
MIGIWVKRAIYTAIGGFLFRKGRDWYSNRNATSASGPYGHTRR